jgi:hypothetical protein
MISIIISSLNESIFIQFSDNVKKTIGSIIYEIIKIDNPGLMGICEAYNKGASRAIYPYFIFCHEDILFHTINWGEYLLKIFYSDIKIGLVGVLGGKYKPAYNSGWSIASSDCTSSFIIGTHYGKSHFSKTKRSQSISILINSYKDISINNFESEICNESVVTLDGLFLATTRLVFKEFQFDENKFKNFHCYDIDFSLQIYQKYDVVVNQNILIEHLSVGNFNENWITETIKLQKKWQKFLPISSSEYTKKQLLNFEFLAFENYLRICKNNKISITSSIYLLFNFNYIRSIGFFSFIKFNLLLIKKMFFFLLNSFKKFLLNV